MRAVDFARKAWSPTASASSISRIRGLHRRGDGEVQASAHTRRVRPQRPVDRLADVGELDDLVDLLVDLVVRHAEREAAEADVAVPVAAAINVAPTPSSLGSSATRTSPLVGASRPATAASSVDLPDPLGPTTPIVSPSAASKETPSEGVDEAAPGPLLGDEPLSQRGAPVLEHLVVEHEVADAEGQLRNRCHDGHLGRGLPPSCAPVPRLGRAEEPEAEHEQRRPTRRRP